MRWLTDDKACSPAQSGSAIATMVAVVDLAAIVVVAVGMVPH